MAPFPCAREILRTTEQAFVIETGWGGVRFFVVNNLITVNGVDHINSFTSTVWFIPALSTFGEGVLPDAMQGKRVVHWLPSPGFWGRAEWTR